MGTTRARHEPHNCHFGEIRNSFRVRLCGLGSGRAEETPRLRATSLGDTPLTKRVLLDWILLSVIRRFRPPTRPSFFAGNQSLLFNACSERFHLPKHRLASVKNRRLASRSRTGHPGARPCGTRTTPPTGRRADETLARLVADQFSYAFHLLHSRHHNIKAMLIGSDEPSGLPASSAG